MAKTGKPGSGWIIFLVAAMLVTGTLNTLTTKMQFGTKSIGKDGEEEFFSKPWFATFNMLSAMFLVGLIDKVYRSTCAPATLVPDNENALLQKDAKGLQMPWATKILWVSLPAAFDLAATGLCCMGMLYIPASIWQMLKVGYFIFCGILSVVFLKMTLHVFHWVGLGLCVLGLCTVGMSSVLGDSQQPNTGGAAQLIFGMSLVMGGQGVQAAQVIAEEFLMKDVDLPAMQVVGWEGFWGTLIMIVFVYPLLWMMPGHDHGHYEDVEDTIVMIRNSPQLFWLVMLYLFSCGSFNASGIKVTGELSATHRMMLDASRTSVIWCFGLGMHYLVDPNAPTGEAWTSYSFLQLVGFGILVCGQGVYGEMIKVPGLAVPPPSINDDKMFCSPGSLHMASPLPRES